LTLKTIEQYGHPFQIKVISSLLTSKEFLQNIIDVLSDEDFPNSAHKWIIKEIIKYYDKYHTNVSMDVLKVELQKVENEILQLSIKEQLKLAYEASDEDLKYVQEEFSNFCKNQQLKKALLKSVDLLKIGDYESIKFIVESAMKSGQDKNIGHEYLKDVESRYREDHRTVIPTPWAKFNDLTQGGIGNGDLGLIFGSPGGGKSWCLVSLGAYAVSLGFNVLHYTLELGEDYVAKRYDAFFTRIPVNTISQHREQVEETINRLPGKLIVKEYPIGGATTSTLESHIQKSENLGVKPDLIIIDYIDLLSTKKRSSDRKGELDHIYRSIKGLARQLNLPIWSVSQVNRAGARDEIVEGDKAAGSYDKIMISDVCISLSRQRQDKVNGTGRFHIMKNRYGIDGLTFKVKADTSTGHFEVTEYDESEETTASTPSAPADFDSFDKKLMQNQFFKLNV
jgi:replicative DNA helicase